MSRTILIARAMGLSLSSSCSPAPPNRVTQTMSASRLLYGITVFLGAFLLFLVEPMAAKQLLPTLGGSSAVWLTCLVFFQVMLLLGYLYAHLLTRDDAPRWRRHLYLASLAVAVVLLIMHRSMPSRPQSRLHPSSQHDLRHTDSDDRTSFPSSRCYQPSAAAVVSANAGRQCSLPALRPLQRGVAPCLDRVPHRRRTQSHAQGPTRPLVSRLCRLCSSLHHPCAPDQASY